jgi:integrase
MAYRTAHRAAKKYLNPSRMADFTPAKLTEFYERGKKDGLSKSGITSYVRFLQGMYATAIKEGWFKGENPFHSTRDNKRDSVVRFLSKEDAQKLLAAAKELDKVTYLFIAIALHTGMRKDEVANLRYEEIDFDRKVITLQAKKADPKRRIQEFQLKSKLARSIPLKTELAEILAPYRKAEGYVILPTTGENVSRFRWRMPRAFAKAQKESGVKANPHLFRHTFASWAALEGISIFKISKWLGHASVQLTSDVYAHLQAHDADIDRF